MPNMQCYLCGCEIDEDSVDTDALSEEGNCVVCEDCAKLVLASMATKRTIN